MGGSATARYTLLSDAKDVVTGVDHTCRDRTRAVRPPQVAAAPFHRADTCRHHRVTSANSP